MDDTERVLKALPSTHSYITGSHGNHNLTEYDEVGDEIRGPHPVHGSENWPSGQGNFAVNRRTGQWYCFREGHKTGGGLLNWIAVDEGLVSCSDADDITAVYPDVLEIAADEGGIDLTMDVAEKKEARNRREMSKKLTDIHSAAASHFHSNLTPEVREWVHDKYGLSDAVLDAVNVGFASPQDGELKRNLDFSEVELMKAGLMLDTGGGIKDFFSGRLMFPYWARGKVRYFVGRKTPWTPDEDWEGAKYKKLPTNDTKETVHELVDEPIFGRDTAIGADRVVVTEGVTDVLAAVESGYPAISPVTTQFKEDRIREAAELVDGRRVAVVMDEDPDSGAGVEGATQTLKALDKYTSVHTTIGIWRLAEDGMTDGDLCDYLADQEPVAADRIETLFGSGGMADE